MITRRTFIRQGLTGAGALFISPAIFSRIGAGELQISLAEWSLHRALKAEEINHLDFPAIAKNEFGVSAVEYVNGFFGGTKMSYKEAAKDMKYLGELLQRSKDAGVVNHLIMVDEEGSLATPDKQERLTAVDNHKKWIDAAKFLGCRTVRVNLHGKGEADAKKAVSIDSLTKLGAYAKPMDINVVVENHGSHSSNGKWMASVMQGVNQPNVGTLPDFGNFCISHPWGTTQEGCDEIYDRYLGMQELLPFAKGVSAKSYDFDANGEQPMMDYKRLISLVKTAGFQGYIGIEFEGLTQNEKDGIRKTKQLLERYI
jgi:sugar phosphate isomerase/epimerase